MKEGRSNMKTKSTKKLMIITEALALSLLMGNSAFAQTVSESIVRMSASQSFSSGTGVGNFPSDREAYINQIKAELMAALIPGDSDYHNYLSWCSQIDRKSTRLNSSHSTLSRMPSSA